jgi:group I intron endonuclease
MQRLTFGIDFDGVRSGIYLIKNTMNGRFYIGSAIDLNKRIKEHDRQLKEGEHHSYKLQKDFNVHTLGGFEVLVLEYVSADRLIEREQYYMDSMHPYYNVAPVAGSSKGVVRSQEYRDKISRSLRGHKQSAETVEKKASACRGDKHWTARKSFSKETRMLKSLQMKGRRWISKGNESKQVEQKRLEVWLQCGWVLGRLSFRKHGKYVTV